MRDPIPPIPEEVTALKERLQHEHDGHKKRCLQMFYGWPVGKPAPAKTWRACWASIAIPFAIGWQSMPPEVWPPCWRQISPRQTRLARARGARQPWTSPVPPRRLGLV
jgi:hypothetical protein